MQIEVQPPQRNKEKDSYFAKDHGVRVGQLRKTQYQNYNIKIVRRFVSEADSAVYFEYYDICRDRRLLFNDKPYQIYRMTREIVENEKR